MILSLGLERLAAAARSRLRDERGVAAVEFALIVPILITLYLGMVEFSRAITADRKVTSVSSATADLVARTTAMNTAEMNNIFQAATSIMTPYSASPLNMVVTAVNIDAGGIAKVDWSKGYQGGSPKTDGATVTLPNGLATPNTCLVMTEVTYNYQSALNYIIDAPITLSDTFYMRPRSVACIPFQ